jgi:hypothetical protein
MPSSPALNGIVVIDGANLAWEFSNLVTKKGSPDFRACAIACRWLRREHGLEGHVVVHARWIDERLGRLQLSAESLSGIEWLERERLIFSTPVNNDDDYYCINYAVKNGYPILTNDMYRDHLARGMVTRRELRTIKYTFMPSGHERDDTGMSVEVGLEAHQMLRRYSETGRL